MMTESEEIEFIVDLFAMLGTGLIPYSHFQSHEMLHWVGVNGEKIAILLGEFVLEPLEAIRRVLPLIGLRLVNYEGDGVEDKAWSVYGVIGEK